MASTKPKNRLVSSTESLARRFYTTKHIKLWSAKLAEQCYRAFIIDEDNKYILCRSDIAESRDDAISMLKKQLQKDLASNEW